MLTDSSDPFVMLLQSVQQKSTIRVPDPYGLISRATY